MAQSIIIIGAGMGGLAAGIYGRMNGYETTIFEMHSKPGGQCTAWRREGYTFDPCIHHFFGCRPETDAFRMWQELGALPRELIPLEACTAVAAPDGRRFIDYYDLDKLRTALLQLAPADAIPISAYIKSIQAFSNEKLQEALNSGSPWKMLRILPRMLAIRKWLKMNMAGYALRFADPFLRRAFAELIYANPEAPLFFHLMRHAGGLVGDIQWPAGGGREFARSIEQRYLALGGKIHYKSRVAKILIEEDKAVGVRLTDGMEHCADVIISNADGRKTILEMLDGHYSNATVAGYCALPADEAPFAVDVFLGVNRDLSSEPSSLVLLLEAPVTIAGHTCENIEVQFYGFDSRMAPPGKGVIKVELTSSHAFWKQLYDTDRQKYAEEKQATAAAVIAILNRYFPGLREQVEVIDVCTLMTWERYMGGTNGWFNFPNRKLDFSLHEDLEDKKFKTTLPGLTNFYFCGVWATCMGSLVHNALSGRTIIRRICRQDGKEFRSGG